VATIAAALPHAWAVPSAAPVVTMAGAQVLATCCTLEA
jgi:hypothetical protein